MILMDAAQAKYLVGFDREESKRLLAEAGYPKGFTTPLYHHPGYAIPWPSRFELAVNELSKVGIQVVATIGLGNLILIEASLSFLGFGVPAPHPTWDGMLSRQGLSYMYQAPWLAIWPGVSLSAAVFGFNMFGDALRDLLDPRLRGGQ
jgi:ABC-type transport system substrate-binding protein